MAIPARTPRPCPVEIVAGSGPDETPPDRAALFGSGRGGPVSRSTATPSPSRPGAGPKRGRAHESLDLAVADRRRTDRRRQTEVLVQRAAWLRGDERAMVEAVYGEGRSCADLARLLGVPADTVRRRVRRAARRAASGLFGFVVTHREAWSPTRRRVATRCVLRGATLREAAADLGLSLHAVRKHWDAIRALYDADRRDGGVSNGGAR